MVKLLESMVSVSPYFLASNCLCGKLGSLVNIGPEIRFHFEFFELDFGFGVVRG